ncbi:hypothetical protein E6C60_3241 [Paenibacillus algicola]|uniref:Uncharacterized protein n=1 Tax=Paenibacillus algicola TaxID=2565926 RepID=A0A4P8XME0_9BACL|nr:hypothetical protein E6C60_3241 [Paenibacillus algicola]
MQRHSIVPSVMPKGFSPQHSSKSPVRQWLPRGFLAVVYL